jgi:glycosyltransferase involved in cell wall biosynthesis
MAEAKFIVITAAKDEARYLGRTIESVVSQSPLPAAWVIVDDGSVDDTAVIARAAAKAHPWIKVVTRREGGPRDVGAGQARAIHYGLQQIGIDDYDFLFNIDADIVLKPDYFRVILRKFAEAPQLGIAGGQLYENFRGNLSKMRVLPLGMIGAVQAWRRECFQEIGGLARGPGWDGIACFQAMMLGWETRTFPDEELKALHLRPEGSSIKHRHVGWARHGEALYFAGAHPLWLLASAAYHALDYPYLLSGLCMIIGYLAAAARGRQQYGDGEFRRFLRQWQLHKLAGLLGLR